MRPNPHDYYMGIAFAVRRRASCKGKKVGAIFVKENRIITTGYNGTPEGIPNCEDGGCDRCANREKYPPSKDYDICICVHAEQNALISAARFGISTNDAIVYTTTRPCFGCLKELIQAKVQKIYYLHDWRHPYQELQSQYDLLESCFEDHKPERLNIIDPDQEWAMGKAK